MDSIVSSALAEFFEENPNIAKRVAMKAIDAAKARNAAKKARDLVRRKNAFSLGGLPGKLADCSSKKTEETEMYIVEGESAGGCFSGETKIALTDGRSLSFKELVEEYKEGKENFCYTILNNESVEIAKIENPRLIKKNVEVIKIVLDNDEEIICTPDHKFMLRDGTYKEAKNLTKEDSLMPLYEQNVINKVNMLKLIHRPELIQNYNHKIKKIEFLTEKIDVYDLEVSRTHNFALASGIFVHNSAKQARNKEIQAILPLKGKILNVEKANPIKAFSSEEIANLITVIGTGVKETFDADKLRYGKIIIMADADVDGEHIKTLLLTLFFRFMPQLIENGKIFVAVPPLYKVRKNKDIYVYSDEELKKVIKEMQNASVTRFKGLGEMNPEQLWETTMNPKTRFLKKVTIDDAVEADATFSMLMGDDVQSRKEFIFENAHEANLDV